jgi:hypothetical protein
MKEALKKLLELHYLEMSSDFPSPEEWKKAVDAAQEALIEDPEVSKTNRKGNTMIGSPETLRNRAAVALRECRERKKNGDSYGSALAYGRYIGFKSASERVAFDLDPTFRRKGASC